MAWTPSNGTGPVVNLVKKYENLDSKIANLLGEKPSESDIESFPYDMYKFIIRSLRNIDQDSSVGGSQLLQRFLKGPNEIFYLLKQQVDNLNTLFSAEDIDEDYLESLAHLVGFTKKLPQVFKYTDETELRRIVNGATEFWKHTVQDLGVEQSVRLISGNRFKYRDYIDFRNIIGEQLITEELEDDDPYLLSETTRNTFITNTDGETQYGGILNRFSQTVFGPAPPATFQFTKDDIGGILSITGDTGTPSNNGNYEIINVDEVNEYVEVGRNFPAAATDLTFTLYFPYNEYIQELRLVDSTREYDGAINTTNPTRFTTTSTLFTNDDIGKKLRILNSSNDQNGSWKIGSVISSSEVDLTNAYFTTNETGLQWSIGPESVNRQLLTELLELQRAPSERINVAYIDFLDRFETDSDLSQWDDSGIGTYTASVDNKVLTLSTTSGNAGIICNKTYTDNWESYRLSTKMAIKTNGLFRIPFLYQSSSTYFYLEIYYNGFGTGFVKLFQNQLGPLQIGSTYNFPSLNLDTYWTYSINCYIVKGYSQDIEVELDGIPIINASSAARWYNGTFGLLLSSTTGSVVTAEIDEVEAYRYPLTIDRVGPNP